MKGTEVKLPGQQRPMGASGYPSRDKGIIPAPDPPRMPVGRHQRQGSHVFQGVRYG